MTISDQLLLMFSAIGGLNGLLLAAYFFAQRVDPVPHRLLALLLLMLSVRVLKSVLFFFNPDIGKQILQLGLSACWMIGPILFCYCQSVCRPASSWRQLRWQLFLPLLIVLLTGSLWPYHHYPQLWGGVLYQVINYSWLLYIGLSLKLLWRTSQEQDGVAVLVSTKYQPLIVMILSNLLIWGAFHFASYTSYISGALTFSLLLCFSVLTVFYRRQPAAQPTEAYANKKMTPDEAAPLITHLERWIEQQRPYLNPDLTMPKLARQLGWPSNRLSQLLNDNLAQTFPDYVNHCRIQHAKRLLSEQPAMKMQTLAEQSGFNSLSTFYAAFKKFCGMTPARFKQNLPDKPSETINPHS